MSAVDERSAAAPPLPNPSGPRWWWPFSHRRWEAADSVIAAVAILVAVIFAVFALLCFQGYGSAITGAKARAQAGADTLAEEVKWFVGTNLTVLELVEEKLALLPAALDPNDRAELDSALRTLPATSRLAIYDAQGLAVSNGGSPALPADISTTDYFALLRGGAARMILPLEIDRANGEGLIVFAQALGTEVFSGVALLGVDETVLHSFLSPQNLGADATLNVVRSDGWLVGRAPAVTETLNFSQTSPFWPQVTESETGTYIAVSSIDGQPRVAGFRHLPDLGLVVFATISLDTLIGGLWTAIGTVLWLLVPLSLALIGGALWMASLLRRSARTQRTLAAAVAHNDVLFREIHHRVKNNLQSVASLLQMQPIPREIKINMGQRIAAMSAVHEHIYRSDNFETVRVRDYLQTLIGSIRAGHDPNVSVVEELADIAVSKDVATPLGLITNEVVANAFKHAFADGREGKLTVRLVGADQQGMLTVEDNGVGFDPQQPTKGIGRRLIGALTQQIGGESRFDTTSTGGSRFTLRFPLASEETAP